MRIGNLMLLGLVIRMALIGYGEIQDKLLNLKYTDIDYSVYNDGSRYVLEGGSPYERHTYRYTPILAYMMIPNILVFESFGKVVFSCIDILVSMVIEKLIRMSSKTVNDRDMQFLLSLWLFNPLTIQVSTRGNADTVVVLFVYLTLYLLAKGKYVSAGLTYGFVVHFKIYPIIYSLPIFFYIDHSGNKIIQGKFKLIKSIFTRNRIIFTLVSATLFIALLILFHQLYPDAFLYQTYIYHLIRKDNRHNFSPYFYFMYLYFTSLTPIQSTLAFLPQFMLLLLSAIRYYKDLPFALLLQTLTFVVFNKVCTAQYFLWWMALLPLALVNSHFRTTKKRHFLLLVAVWLTVEITWNLGAYLLEIRGYNAFTLIFLSCILFFVVNVYLMHTLITNHIPRPFLSLDTPAKTK